MSIQHPAIADPVELLAHLRAGDSLARCMATGWVLVRSGIPVDASAVAVLHTGGPWLTSPDNEPFDFGGGCLAPKGDGLPGFGATQTYAWAEGRSDGLH